MAGRNVLIAGETWSVVSTHQKGFDSFQTVEFGEGLQWLRAALEGGGWTVHHQPGHVVHRDFPATAQALAAYDAVVLSDIGANTLLLHPDTFVRSKRLPDRLAAIRDYVAGGGGLVMVGGYLTFQGIEGKARYHGTPVEEALPVTISPYDDRAERPAGVVAEVTATGHPIAAGIGAPWPPLLGYNRVTPKPGATVVATVGADPLIVAGTHGQGRSVAYTSDCGPHWAPPEFVEWPGYARLWCQLMDWTAGRLD